MKFLIISLKVRSPGEYYPFPLGLAYVSSFLKQKGFNVFCRNSCHYTDSIEKQLSDIIQNNQIDVVCTGGMSISYGHIAHILRAAKNIKPDIITVVGGAIVTSDPRLAMENMQIDYGVVGEGEKTMADLADALVNKHAVKNVKGIVYFDEDKNLVINEPREPIQDLDNLPFPDYDGFEFDRYLSFLKPADGYFYGLDEQRTVSVLSSRSCPFSCTFCYHQLGKIYRTRSVDNFIKEITYLVGKYNIKSLVIWDELFSVNKKRLFEFADRIKKLGLSYVAALRVETVDEQVLKALKDSGLTYVSYGIESISDKILKSMKKKITKAQIENALKLTRKAHIAIQGNLLFGDIAETEDTIEESINWWINYPEYDLNLVPIITVPNAPIYQYALAKGLIKNKFRFMIQNFPLINLTGLSQKKYEEMLGKIENYRDDERYLTVGRVVSSKHSHTDAYGRKFYKLTIECPDCHYIVEYRNYHQVVFDQKFFPIVCKNCYRRLRIEITKAFRGNYSLYKLLKFNISMRYRYYYNSHPMLRLVNKSITRHFRDIRTSMEYSKNLAIRRLNMLLFSPRVTIEHILKKLIA